MRRAPLLLPFVLGGCLIPITPTDAIDTSDTDGTTSGCTGGFVEPTTVSAAISSVRIAGVVTSLGFDPDVTRAGEPAVCVSPDGTAARLVVAEGGQAVGLLSITTPGTAGTYDITAQPLVELALDGLEDVLIVGSSAWVTGTLNVTSVGSPLTLNLTTATGSDVSGTTVSLTATLSATVP